MALNVSPNYMIDVLLSLMFLHNYYFRIALFVLASGASALPIFDCSYHLFYG